MLSFLCWRQYIVRKRFGVSSKQDKWRGVNAGCINRSGVKQVRHFRSITSFERRTKHWICFRNQNYDLVFLSSLAKIMKFRKRFFFFAITCSTCQKHKIRPLYISLNYREKENGRGRWGMIRSAQTGTGTHAGWLSVTESITRGPPMVTHEHDYCGCWSAYNTDYTQGYKIFSGEMWHCQLKSSSVVAVPGNV